MAYNFTTKEDCELLLGSTYYSFLFNIVDPSSPPSNVSGNIRFSTLLELSWTPPPAMDRNGLIISYVVKLSAVETDSVWTLFAVNEDIKIGSLNYSYHYNCTVAASTTVGVGPFSPPIIIQIEESGLCGLYA